MPAPLPKLVALVAGAFRAEPSVVPWGYLVIRAPLINGQVLSIRWE